MLDWAIDGASGYSFFDSLVFLAIVTHLTIVSVTVYLHRFSSHRALALAAPLKHFFRFWLWLTTGQETQGWTAVHRRHHAECETSKDPHSPVVKGLGTIMWRGVEEYKAAISDEETIRKYGKGCPDDWLEKHIYSRNSVGIALMLVIDLILFGVAGLTIWAIQMIWIPLFGAGVINGFGHTLGYRNFECADASRNIVPWGILVGGEELHNNHHTYPNSAKLSVKRYEFDIGWLWIKVFSYLGLASVISKGPVVQRGSKKFELDTDSVWALINDRFNVMARYAEEVVGPVVEHEYLKADQARRKLLKRAGRLLTMDEILLDQKTKHRISTLLENNVQIKKIYELKLELQEIWSHRGGDAAQILELLSDWVAKAEASGLGVLNEFADTLKTYSVPAYAR